jgi:hypothetical protein
MAMRRKTNHNAGNSLELSNVNVCVVAFYEEELNNRHSISDSNGRLLPIIGNYCFVKE